jgi:hypothetical protein
LDRPFVLLDDAQGNGQPAARPLAFALGREEGIEDLPQGLGVDPGPGVRHPGREVTEVLVSAYLGAEAEPAEVGHGVSGVVDQVNEHLGQLVPVAVDVASGVLEHGDDLDVLGLQFVVHEREGPLDDVRHRHILRATLAAARELE